MPLWGLSRLRVTARGRLLFFLLRLTDHSRVAHLHLPIEYAKAHKKRIGSHDKQLAGLAGLEQGLGIRGWIRNYGAIGVNEYSCAG